MTQDDAPLPPAHERMTKAEQPVVELTTDEDPVVRPATDDEPVPRLATGEEPVMELMTDGDEAGAHVSGQKRLVGLTGGIGAGKSAVATRLAELGAVVIDADRLAREVVAPGTDGLAEVVAAFGEGVLDASGGLDRPALGRVVFGDDAKRRRLEAIIHPRVRARTAEMFAAAPDGAVVVNDVPLLVEAGLAAGYEFVIVVEAPVAVRVARLVHDRGMSEAEARARIDAQASDEQRRAVAHAVLVNDGTLDDLRERVDELWRTRLTV